QHEQVGLEQPGPGHGERLAQLTDDLVRLLPYRSAGFPARSVAARDGVQRGVEVGKAVLLAGKVGEADLLAEVLEGLGGEPAELLTLRADALDQARMAAGTARRAGEDAHHAVSAEPVAAPQLTQRLQDRQPFLEAARACALRQRGSRREGDEVDRLVIALREPECQQRQPFGAVLYWHSRGCQLAQVLRRDRRVGADVDDVHA